MTDPQDNTQFKADIASRIAKMKERRRGDEQKKMNWEINKAGEQQAHEFAEYEQSKILEQRVRDIFGVPDQKIVDVQVDKPLVRNSRPWFNLNKRFIEKCIREGKLMRLTWPDGSALHKPEEWLKGEPYQKEFKFAGQPMEMLGRYLDLDE